MKLRALVTVLSLVLAVGSAEGTQTDFTYDFTGYSVSPAVLETVFGPKVAELDAQVEGYDFGGALDALRNLNLITQVFQVPAGPGVSIGIGEGGSSIEVPGGGYVFAYTLDYTGTLGGVTQSPINDLKLLRLIESPALLGGISNPGPFMALDEITGSVYNTAPLPGAPSGTPPFEAYPDGVTGVELDYADYSGFGPFRSSELDLEWPGTGQINPGTTAMGLVFTTSNVQIGQIGVGTGDSGEGAEVFGGGTGLVGIPALVPIIPEPASVLTLMLGAAFLARRRAAEARR